MALPYVVTVIMENDIYTLKDYCSVLSVVPEIFIINTYL